ncbi:MAG: hypothetical protein HY704_08725 [Gemmatimonadetes bacterium]|nr:hypothetical protein [Gemmatimonadota bacterium]
MCRTSGDREDAVGAYERFAEKLRREFELEPSPETRALSGPHVGAPGRFPLPLPFPGAVSLGGGAERDGSGRGRSRLVRILCRALPLRDRVPRPFPPAPRGDSRPPRRARSGAGALPAISLPVEQLRPGAGAARGAGPRAREDVEGAGRLRPIAAGQVRSIDPPAIRSRAATPKRRGYLRSYVHGAGTLWHAVHSRGALCPARS